MFTVITGASGHLGRLVVDQLLAAGTPPAQIVDNKPTAPKPATRARRSRAKFNA